MPRLGARPLVGLGDIDRAGPAELLRCRVVAVFSGPLGIGVVVARDEIGRGKRHEKRIFAIGMRRPSDRFARPLRRDPDRRMRALSRFGEGTGADGFRWCSMRWPSIT